MSKDTLQVAASILILIGLVLLVIGLGGAPLLWQIGLGVVALAMLLSLGTHWAREKAAQGERGAAEPEEG